MATGEPTVADGWENDSKLSMQEIASLLPQMKKQADSKGATSNLGSNGRQLNVELLGHGAAGLVYRISCGSVHLAIKVFKIFTKDEKTLFDNESASFKKLAQYNHGNIVRFYDSYAVELDRFIVLELAEASLHDALHKQVKGFLVVYSISNVLVWAGQIAEGVAFLHRTLFPDDDGKNEPKPMMHRDLKPENILMFNHCQQAKITDLGFARLDASISKGSKSSNIGTTAYMAPEVKHGGLYDCKCDVYSLGAVIWEMIYRMPFAKRNEPEKENKISSLLKAVYSPCLSVDPCTRPDIQTLLKAVQYITNVCKGRTTHMIRSGPQLGSAEQTRTPPTDMQTFNILWTPWELDDADKRARSEFAVVPSSAPWPSRIVAFGGEPQQDVGTSVCSASTAGEDEWRYEAYRMPHARCGGAAAVLSARRVLLLGGSQGGSYPNYEMCQAAHLLHWHDPHPAAAPTFSTVHNIPLLSRHWCDAVAVDSNSKVLIAGGKDLKNRLKSAELFLQSLARCARLPDMNHDRCELAMAVDTTRQPNQVLATGGNIDHNNSVEWFDLAEMRWSVGPAMIEGRNGHAAASLGSRVYVTGGWRKWNSAESLDGRESRWQPTAEMLNGRYTHRLVSVGDNRLCAVGGYWGEALSSVETFDERNKQWQANTPMNVARYWLQAVVL